MVNNDLIFGREDLNCVCRYKFKPGDMIHKVPIGGQDLYQLLCDKCYEFYLSIP